MFADEGLKKQEGRRYRGEADNFWQRLLEWDRGEQDPRTQ